MNIRGWLAVLAVGLSGHLLALNRLGAAPKPVVLSALPAVFEPNTGQAPAGVEFLSRGARQTLSFERNGIVVRMAESDEEVRLEPLAPSANVRLRGLAPLTGVSNYLKGERWLTDVPHFERVRYESLYPGIDAVFYGTQNKLEFDVLVLPQADPWLVQFRVRGARRVARTADGEIALKTSNGEIRLGKPSAYQEDESGRRVVACRFRLHNHVIGFEVGPYDRNRPLIIDPSIVSTYVGGRDTDIPAAVTTDSTGNIYVTGFTASTNFPVSTINYKGALTAGDADAFVMKLDPTAATVIYTTYLGGDLADYGKAIAVDAQGAAYITGATIGKFPMTAGAFRVTPADAPAIFVCKLNPQGNGLAYSTYLDGAGSGQGIALDGAGNAFITGYTYTATFTTTAEAFQRAYGGATDAFVVKLNATGTAELYSTFLGGVSEDQGMAIRVDSTGSAYVTGFTASSNYPTSTGAFRTTYSGATDVFVTKLSANGSSLSYSTFLGGPNADRAYGIDVANSGEAYVAGQTFSSSFPTTASAFRTTHGGGSDAFVAKLDASGAALVYSTFLGGNGSCTVSDSLRLYQCDAAYSISVDGSGQAYVAGLAGTGFPLSGAPQSIYGGNGDAFLAHLDASGSNALISTYLGGGAGDVALGVTNSTASGPVVVGFTSSTNYPGTSGALQPANAGGIEGFLSRLATCPVTLATSSSFFPQTAGSYSLAVLSNASCGWQATSDAGWVTITNGAATGNGQIAYTVSANTGPLRVAHITVNGSTFTLQQVSGACVTLGNTSSWFPAQFNGYFLLVLATCSWTASSTDSWISITDKSGTGSYLINFLLTANTTGSARTGHITVNGQIFTVNQVGAPPGVSCSYALSSEDETFPPSGGSRSILVSTSPGCEWTATNTNNWITLTSGLAGSGEGVLGLSVSPNLTGQARTGQLTVAGYVIYVSQAPVS